MPGINLMFQPDPKIGGYPAYHTGYETFDLVDKVVDPGFRIHRSAAQLALMAVFKMAESRIIPYECEGQGQGCVQGWKFHQKVSLLTFLLALIV